MGRKRICIGISVVTLFFLIVSAVYMTTDIVVLLDGNGEQGTSPTSTNALHTTSSYLTVQVVIVEGEKAPPVTSSREPSAPPPISAQSQDSMLQSRKIHDPLNDTSEFLPDELTAICRDRQGCYKSSCYATGSDTECLPSPFGVPRRKSVDPFLTCIDDPVATDPVHVPPPLPPSSVFRSPPPPLDALSGPEDHKRVLEYARLQLNAFKHLSAKPFHFPGEWTDWTARLEVTPTWSPKNSAKLGFEPTASPAFDRLATPEPTAHSAETDLSRFQSSAPTAASAYRMRARHVVDQKLRKNVYEIENFCVKPLGGISGFMPHVEPFQGEDDVYTMTLDAAGSSFRHVRSWLQSEVEELLSPPAAFIDTKLLIMPVLSRSDNPGHAFHRMTSLLDIREKAFPNSSVSDVATAFLMLEGTNLDLPDDTAPNLANIHETAFPQFLHVVSKSHFALFGKAAVPHGEAVLGISASDSRNQPVCFRKAAMYFTCTDHECREARTYNAQRAIAPLYHQRSPSLLRNFVREMQSCVGVVPRTAPNRTSPLILFPTRSVSRRVVLTPFIIGALAEYLTTDQPFLSDQVKPAMQQQQGSDPAKTFTAKGRLRVLEMIEHSMSDLVHIYSNADIVIGPYGAGLFLSLFMPKHSVVIEVSHDLKRCSATSGLDVAANVYCDYAGNADAMSQHHIAATFSLLPWWRLRGDYDVVPEVFTYALEAALCVLNRPLPTGMDANRGQDLGAFPAMEDAEVLSKRCPFHHRRAQYLQDQHDGNSPGGASPASANERIRQHIRIAKMMLKPAPLHLSRQGEVVGTGRLQHYFDKPEDLSRAITLPRSRRARREERNILIEAPCGLTQSILEEALLLYNLLPLTHFINIWRPHPSAFRGPPSACQPELSSDELDAVLEGIGGATTSNTSLGKGGPRFSTQSAPGRTFATSLRRCTTLGPNPYGVASMQVHEDRQPPGAEFSAAEWRKKLERWGNAQIRAPFSVRRVGSGRQQQRPGPDPGRGPVQPVSLPAPGPESTDSIFCGYHHFALVSEHLTRDTLELVVKHTAGGWKSVLQSN